MRDSSKHLLCDLKQSAHYPKVTMLKRVYFETSALLPALAYTINYYKGSVTEYLGDGVLALFKIDEHSQSETILEAYRCAKDCVNECREIVNDELFHRYRLPPLNIGVGLAYSKALVGLIGLEGHKHPKAFGECVFRASKISNQHNIICVDERLHNLWPKSESPFHGISFTPRYVNNINAFIAPN